MGRAFRRVLVPGLALVLAGCAAAHGGRSTTRSADMKDPFWGDCGESDAVDTKPPPRGSSPNDMKDPFQHPGCQPAEPEALKVSAR